MTLLLYAKRSFRAAPRDLVRAIRQRIAERPSPDLDEARRWLVATGQVEQAVLDAGLSCGKPATAATLAAADVFLDARKGETSRVEREESVESFRQALLALEDRLDRRELEFRVPEGFAWHALYPDSYAQSAERWARRYRHAGGTVSVIGIRSIGTTLAAVVVQALRRCGLEITCHATLRPFGDPFARGAEPQPGFKPAFHNIIVDEGPGLSGSSVAAVARAMCRSGADPDTIHFFVGHGHGPGPAACSATKTWWCSQRIWFTDPDDTLLGGQLLPRELTAVVESAAGEPAVGQAESLDTRRWQALAKLPSLPRAVAPNLETPKRIVRLRSGRRIVLRFIGFALTSGGPGWDTGAHSVSRHGWIAMPWVEGPRLLATDASTAFLAEVLGPYIAGSSDRMLQPSQVQEGIGRIANALFAWAEVRELEDLRAAIERIVEREVSRAQSAHQHAYGDGRLAPHEWVRTSSAVVKVDSFGHACDHTWVGQQPLAWDLAGAEIEWELDRMRSEQLCSTVAAQSGYHCAEETRAFYRAGYCAFRAAAAWFCAAASCGEWRDHLLRACDWYEQRLRNALIISLKPASSVPTDLANEWARQFEPPGPADLWPQG